MVVVREVYKEIGLTNVVCLFSSNYYKKSRILSTNGYKQITLYNDLIVCHHIPLQLSITLHGRKTYGWTCSIWSPYRTTLHGARILN